MKFVLPNTKFNLHPPTLPRNKRLDTPRKARFPSMSEPNTLRGPIPGSQAAKLLGHLERLAQPRVRLYSSSISRPPHYETPQIPRYIFVGDQPGESEIRLGIFAGLRGEDPVGAKAIVEFMDDLVSIPSLGSAFRIYAYPTANSLTSATEAAPKQTDDSLLSETSRKAKVPEASLIEREIFVVQFHGLIVIHTTDDPECLQALRAAVYGANLHEALVSPILSALRPLFPVNEVPVLDSSYSLTANAVLKQRPFELALQIPRSGWQGLYSMALRIALHTAIEQYRSYLAQANNI
jgi:hypothetical protein